MTSTTDAALLRVQSPELSLVNLLNMETLFRELW